MATERNLYAVLGVGRDATDAEIKRAFRRLAQQWHPDVNQDAGRRRPVQGDQRGLPGPVRPAAPPGLRHVRDGRRSAATAGRLQPAGFGSFSDIFDAFFGGDAGRDAARPPARPAPTSATTSGSRSRRPSSGVEKEIEFSILGRCETCSGQRRQARHGADRLRPVRRPRRDPLDAPDDARPDGQRHRLPEVPGRGQAHHRAVRDVPRRRPDRAQARRSGSRSRPASTRATRSASRTRARSGRAAGRRAASTSPSTSRPIPSLRREGTELAYDADISIAQAALGTRITVPTVEGEEEVEIKAGHPAGHRDPPARPRRAPPPAGRIARRPPRVRQRRRPGEALEAPARAPRPSTRRRPANRSRRTRGGSATKIARRAGLRPAPRPAGAWLELSVAADIEAVEAVAEILGRGAPAGTSVEPAFELIDEGLGARVDPTRPAIVRAYLPAGDARGRPRGRRGGRRGARPPPGVRAAADRRADDAARPRGRLGRGLEGPLPGAPRRAPARDPADVAAPPPTARRRRPRARSGDGVRDRASTRRPASAWPASSRSPIAGCSTAPASSTSAAAPGSSRSPPLKLGAREALGVDTDPIAIEATAANAARNRLGRRHRRPRRAACRPARRPVRRRPREPHRQRPRRRSRRCSATSSGPAACSSHRGSSSTARPRSGARSRPPASTSSADRRKGSGSPSRRSGAEERRRLSAGPPTIGPMPAFFPAPPRHPHRPRGQPVPAVDPAAVRAADPPGRGREPEPVRPVPALDAGPRHGVIGLGLAATGIGARHRPRRPRCSASRGCSSRSRSTRRTSPSRSSSSGRTCAA